jgi:hypothetical protein
MTTDDTRIRKVAKSLLMIWLTAGVILLLHPSPVLGSLPLQKLEIPAHILLFFVATMLFLNLCKLPRAVTILLLIAIGTEVLQGFTKTRHFSFNDLIMNLLGITLGLSPKLGLSTIKTKDNMLKDKKHRI